LAWWRRIGCHPVFFLGSAISAFGPALTFKECYRGKESYWISVAGPVADAGEGTDFHAVQHNKVSITPIQLDMTGYDAMDMLSSGLKGQQL